MVTQHMDSRRFVRLMGQGGGRDFLRGDYCFNTLHSGISLHGGRMTAVRDLHCSRLAGAYISFVLLFEGTLDFGINRDRYRFDADGGRVVLVAAGEEVLFSRYLHRGETTVKLSLRGIEHWLMRPARPQLLAHVYSERVRSWPLDGATAALAGECLRASLGNVADALQREADVLRLLADLWRGFMVRYPRREGGDAAVPPAGFAALLNEAFDGGIHHVGGLAAALNVSERTLQRKLHGHFGITAGEWLRHKHMQYALYMLSMGKASIGEVAYNCGYRHASSFTQAFRKYFGCTPAEVRPKG
ncbi:MAG: helix-turn-helix transcriptional regulator [Neisseria sp.]|nr:helix-turn-helix transcriptional regulator [Neisseria sp.]